MKDAYYFSHDTNAFLDPKIRYIVAEYGLLAYGMFWVIIEMLAAQKNYKIPVKGFVVALLPLLQGKKLSYKSEGGLGFFEDEEGNEVGIQIKDSLDISLAYATRIFDSMIDCGLLVVDSGAFYSDSLVERMVKKEEKSNKYRQSALIRWHGKQEKHAIALQPEVGCSTQKMQSKVKESKGNKIHSAFSFDPLWTNYPRKDGKKDAERHFNASVKTQKDYDDIQLALKNFCEAMKGREMQYIKNGSTWFNNWRDWIVMPVGVIASQKRELKANPSCTVCNGTGKIPPDNLKCWCPS